MTKHISMKNLTILYIFFFTLAGCQSNENQKSTLEKTTKKETIEESSEVMQRSELAKLMRNLYNSTKAYGKEQVLNNETYSKADFEKFLAITTATPTDLKDTGAVFRSYAQNFLVSLENLTHPENVNIENYNNMINNCVACHVQHCPGPVPVIKKMKLNNPI